MEDSNLEISMEEIDRSQQVIITVFKKISNWWSSEGYHYLSNMSLSRDGYIEVKLGTILEDEHLEELREKGYIIGGDEDYGFMVDNENNRKLLANLINKRFPSAKIVKWENSCQVRKISDEFLLMDIKLQIYDFKDVLID